MPEGKDRRKTLCLKKKKSKLSRGRGQPRLAPGPRSAGLGPRTLRFPGLHGGRRRAGPGRAAGCTPPGAGGIPGGAAALAGPAGGNAARPRPCSRAGRRPGGGGKSGNLQPPVLGLQLLVHGQREAEEAPGLPRSPDHIVLAGVQVEGGAEPGQEPRRQVEQPQLPRGRHGRAHREGEPEPRWPPCARGRVRGCRAAAAAAAATFVSSGHRAGPTPGTSSAGRPSAPPRGQLPTAE